MENSQEKWDMAVIIYGQECMLEKKENYYTELSNTIANFNYNKNTPLSNVGIQEVILKAIIEDGEESITDANNVTSDAFSHESSSQRENWA